MKFTPKVILRIPISHDKIPLMCPETHFRNVALNLIILDIYYNYYYYYYTYVSLPITAFIPCIGYRLPAAVSSISRSKYHNRFVINGAGKRFFFSNAMPLKWKLFVPRKRISTIHNKT